MLLTLLLTVNVFASTKTLEVNKDYGFIVLCIDGYKWLWTYVDRSTKLQQMYETNTIIRRAIPATCL